jgi:hypothetical protein
MAHAVAKAVTTSSRTSRARSAPGPAGHPFLGSAARGERRPGRGADAAGHRLAFPGTSRPGLSEGWGNAVDSTAPDWHDGRMRWADLVLAYIRVLVWPVVLIALLVIFHPQVRTVLSRFADRIKELKSVKALGAEFDFGQIVLEAKEDIEIAEREAAVKPILPEQVLPSEAREYTAINSPQTTVVAAWQDLEAKVALIYKRLDLSGPPGSGVVTQTAAICSELIESSTLSEAAGNAILTSVTRLAHLRRSIEDRIVTKLEAYEFEDTVQIVSDNLSRAYTLRKKRDPNYSPEPG